MKENLKVSQHITEKFKGKKRHTIIIDKNLLERYERICKSIGLGHISGGLISHISYVVNNFEFKSFYGINGNETPVFFNEMTETLNKFDKNIDKIGKKTEEIRTSFVYQLKTLSTRIVKLEREIRNIERENEQ